IKRDEQERITKEEGASPKTLNLCVNKIIKMNNNLLFELRCQGKSYIIVHIIQSIAQVRQIYVTWLDNPT
ncbi:unnamed protein product, partial [Rotaria sp. Silwood2]